MMKYKNLTSRFLSFLLAVVMVGSLLPGWTFSASAETAPEADNSLAGKTFSILGASISTYAGTSNGAAADTTNSTIRDNAKYYPNATVDDVTLTDTWWMQAASDLGLRLLVNNSWSGSSLLYERSGTVGAYVDRCVQLHDDTGDNAGETPDIIGIQMGTNDFQYYKDTLGTADIDYAALIAENADGTYSYAEPVTSLEAAAIVLHKISVRYPNAEVYYLNISQRVDGTDELIRSFNAELKQVVEHFGAHIVDIYGSAITMEDFDTYIGDGRVHPNKLGMDAYTEAFKRALIANTAYTVDTHTVTFALDGVTANYGDNKIVVDGDSFTVDLTASGGEELAVTVTMGGKDVTDTCYAGGTVTIDAVTADVTITAEATDHVARNYRWEFDGTDLVCVSGDNALTKNAGTTTDGVFSKTRYALETAVVLSHDQPWVVEWKCKGTFLNANGSSGARVFSSTDANADYNARYIFKSNTNGIIAMGEKDTKGSHNYGIALADYDIDWTELHTYRLENRIAEDGTNMVWLYVDGAEIGPMNHYYVGTTDKNTTSDWLSGKDFVFPYMGTDTHGFTNASIEYIQVWEGGKTSEPMSLRYDDRLDLSGKTVEIVDAGMPTSYKVGYGVAEGTLDDAVVTLDGEKLIATGIGTAKVRIDGKLYEINVEKAKVNIVVIMGQSNAGNHFANATSDITCSPGTAYWWGNGQGTAAVEPVPYTQPSMGFHTPLLAELYAQSVAAGDPVKPVMVWQEGITSKNGQSIVKWAASDTDTSGTDATAAMLKNCLAYYEEHGDKYEVVGTGIYWLQGESDVAMKPEKYTGLFMAMWNKLKDAGAEYLAFFRVRRSVTECDGNYDGLAYHGSLNAQLQMVNNNADMFMASTITENWVGSASTKHSIDIRNYITLMEEYGKDGSYNDSYGNAATVENGVLTTTMKTLYGSNNKCHYGKFGYGIIGADAAFNMYNALHTEDFAIVRTDTSGKASAQIISKPGEKVTLDITGLEENLAFRADCGSTAGTLNIKVESGNTDITEKVIATGANTFGTVDTEILREYDDVAITVTYSPVSGASGSVVYSIIDNSPEPPKMYFWDFENDLNARNENGEVVNSFGETALNGSYVLENGMLKGNSLQLALEKQLKLFGDESWSIEWKFGEVTENTTGFLLCNTTKSAIGTKALYFSFAGNVMISDYKDSKGYYNYFTDEATFASGDCIKITNTYDSKNGKSVLSLWKNGKLIVSDLQKKGCINSSTSGTQDMSAYPLSGDFVFNYLGCTGLQYFPVTGEIDYIAVWEGEHPEAADYSGKTISILGDSISTYSGVSNNTDYNSTIGSNAIYYSAGTLGVYREDTWWQQTIDALGMELLVNNSWSGSTVFQPRKGEASVGYGNRCVNLHTDTTGEDPDIIVVFLGTNDFSYYQDTLGTANVDYDTLITENSDGSYSYATPTTTCEAYAIMLHKMIQRYPDAEIYCMTMTARRDPDKEDSYADVGQPTAFNAELAKIIEHFGCTVVDLENCGIDKEAEIFDAYMGDGRVHPNAQGMDKISEALISTMLGEATRICAVNYVLTGVESDNSTATVLAGGRFTARLDADGNAMNVVVTMNGQDITDSCYADGVITIASVTGDIIITATAVKEPAEYRWELEGTNLISVGKDENKPTLQDGSVSNGVLTNAYYSLTEQVVLRHELPWVLEFKASGSWSGMVFSAQKTASTAGNTYLFKTTATNGFIGFGERKDSQYHNYGIALGDEGVDTTEEHIYRLENRIASDGTNMVYLLVDGVDYGAMDHYFIGGTSNQNTDVEWLNGKDLSFSYIGASGHAMNNCSIAYIQVWEGGEAAEAMSLRYDDHYDVTGKTVEIVDAGTPTSYQVGYGVEENAVLDTAVVTLDGDTLVATGIGTAQVKIDGVLYEVTVETAPISLLLLAGQSNMQGSEGDANQSIVCPDGMVYSTYGDRYTMTVDNATNFAPSALTGAGCTLNVNGTTTNLEDWPIYLLNEAGAGKAGPDSGFAYEWVQRTGEKVWVVNAAHGGSSITTWQDGGANYEEALLLFAACQETLRKEIAAGHYTLSHMGYFWCQGCTDYSKTAEWYVGKYLTMHENLKTELAFDADSDTATPDVTFEFGGIIPVRAGNESYTSYRQGTYVDTTTAKYYESFKDLRFTGPRVAQYWMGNNPELEDIWLVCNIGEDWVWMPDGTNGVTEYFQTHYENGTVDYITQVAQKESWYTPTTPAAVHDSIHYNQIGYNEVGRESVRNALIMLGEIEAPEVETTVKFLGWDGYTEVTEITAATAGASGTLVVPMVYPLWQSKKVTYSLSDGLTWNYYDLLVANAQNTGTLTSGGKTVTVLRAEPGAHYADHLSQLPENVCSGLNLWNELEHDKYYYANGTGWGIHSSGTVYSVTIPVNPGDRIYASSFGKAGTNGGSSNGIRVTFFSEYGVAKTMAPSEVYTEFTANDGYLVVPEGAMAINVAMWNNDDSNELYILNREHDTSSDICSICGKDSHTHEWTEWEMTCVPEKDEPVIEERKCSGCGKTETREVESVWQTCDLAGHLSQLPENVCCGTNLWAALEHDPEFFSPGTEWHIHSSGTVYSVTIPVEDGDKIFATSFGKGGTNGGSSNGIRVTFFDAYGVVKTLTPAETYAEFTANGGYLIAPEGTVAVNIPMWTNSDGNEIYILNAEHDYSGTTCTICGAEHPEATDYSGKVISILGASICTFDGYIPVADGFNLQHYARYPQDNLLTDVNDTWWMQVINDLDAKLGINDSWRSTEVYNACTEEVNSGYDGTKACLSSVTRIQNLGSNGTPDVILFFGGTNDITQRRPLGTFDPETAPTEVDLTTETWTTVVDAYTALIMRLQYYYPDTEIVVMLPYSTANNSGEVTEKYTSVFAAICEHYGVTWVDMNDCGITTADLPDGTHPDAEGMDYITAAVLDTLLNDVAMEAGENVVYTVTHTLTNAGASLGYYKGISAGKPFVETLTGENLTVTVTMGGEDVTDTCYADGVVTISSVTGDLVITAKAEFNADGRLQKLPENICGGTNLWPLLVPGNEYYTASGWGNNAEGTNYSVTIPVTAGDQLWATSFGTTAVNGFAANGVRITWFSENGVLESLTRDKVYAEFAANGYVIVPEGAVAVNIPMASNADTWEIYLLSREHDYSGTTCTICGAEHPEAADYAGKVISILGDSISTFAGYIPVADGFNLEHLARYPQDNLLTDVNETWWMQVITQLDAKLGINDSWRGSTVSGYPAVTTGVAGYLAAMSNTTQIQNLGSNGTPDVILFYGGTNDLAHTPKLGIFDPDTAPTEVDLTTLKWDNLADAYCHALLRLRHFHPDAEIVCLLPTYTASYYSNDKLAQGNALLTAICEHYGVTYVDLRYCGITTADLPDGIHPDATGMDYITDAVLEALLAECEMEAGENVVYSVTHELDGVTASLGYYKGISAGQTFTETLSADTEMTVTVTMDGVDITGACYADGTITISSVTGDLVVTAEAKFSLGDRLQQLPENICAGTNLWPILEHDPDYYTVNGWGVHSSGKVYSVTIPINPGDQIWATSFGKAGTNGSGTNGIRLTWFGENGAIKSLSADETYSEFTANGYLTAPDGANAVNVVMWTGDDSNELYILNREHIYGNWTQLIAPTCDSEGQDVRSCTICGSEVYRDTRISGVHNKILVSNPVAEGFFEGKTILCLGDSLTNGTGVEKDERYHALMGETLGATIKAGGVSGGVLCTGGHLPERFQYMTEEYLTKNNVDVVTIFLGINDWDNGVVNGTYQGKLKYDESLTYYNLGEFGTDDTTTIYGAAKMWCERIIELQATEECKDIMFVFATPVITSYNKSVTNARDWNQDKVNVFGYTLRQYCTAIMEVCAYYGVPVLDLNMYSGMYYHSEEDNNVDYFGGDGIHPGVNGHAMMADAFVEFLLEGYTYEERTVADCGHSYERFVTEPTCTAEGYTTYRCPDCHYSYVGDYVDALGHDYSAGLCTICGYDAVTVGVTDGTLTITSDELAEGTILWLAAYDGSGKFLSMQKIVWSGTEQTLTLPEGTAFKLLFVDSAWTPLRTAVDI